LKQQQQNTRLQHFSLFSSLFVVVVVDAHFFKKGRHDLKTFWQFGEFVKLPGISSSRRKDDYGGRETAEEADRFASSRKDPAC
jgi:hypothetical protein